MKDSFNRNIDYLRISLTDRCNLRCVYCMPAEGVKDICHDEILRTEEIFEIVKVASYHGIKTVRLTGGEPLVRKGVVDLVSRINELANIEDIALTTNATLLPKFASELKDAGLRRVNISLDTLDSEQYRKITRCGDLDDALFGINAALECGFDPIKVNVVVIKSLNQDFLSFAKMTLERPITVRFIEFMPIGDCAHTGIDSKGWGEADVIKTKDLISQISELTKAAGLGELSVDENAPRGRGPAVYYKLPEAKGSIGFISPLSNHFCSSCNRLRLTSDGKFRSCLFSDEEFDVKNPLRSALPENRESSIEKVFKRAISQKPEAHNYRRGTKRPMSKIGG